MVESVSAISDEGTARKRPAAARASAVSLPSFACRYSTGIRVEPAPVAVDRLPHRPRVRREEERRQVDAVRGERELGAHRGPVGQVWRGLEPLHLPESDGAGRETGPRQ